MRGALLMGLRKILLLIGFIVYGFLTCANRALEMSFSADFYGSDGNNGRIYIDSNKTRMETKEMTSITRFDKMLV